MILNEVCTMIAKVMVKVYDFRRVLCMEIQQKKLLINSVSSKMKCHTTDLSRYLTTKR